MVGHAPTVFIIAVVGFWFAFGLMFALAGALDRIDEGKGGCIGCLVLTVIAIVLLVGGIGFGLFLG